MYAVIMSGGKQYRVQTGDIIKLETVSFKEGETIAFDKVLLVGEGDSIQFGQPYLDKGVVKAVVLSHGRHKKIKIIKFKRRKHHEKWQGHRQNYTEVKITEIQ